MVKRYWAFRDLRFEQEGYFPNELYKALWNALTDRGYAVFEWRYAQAFLSSGANAAVGIWVCTKEIEKKYTLSVLDVHWKFIWSMVPKPGATGENPPQIPKGKSIIWMNGAVHTDYVNKWTDSLLLRPFFPIRENYFYRKRRLVHLDAVRQDGEAVLKNLQEYLNFLPTIR